MQLDIPNCYVQPLATRQGLILSTEPLGFYLICRPICCNNIGVGRWGSKIPCQVSIQSCNFCLHNFFPNSRLNRFCIEIEEMLIPLQLQKIAVAHMKDASPQLDSCLVLGYKHFYLVVKEWLSVSQKEHQYSEKEHCSLIA